MKIGVLGGGQLGRMLALAGLPLGHSFRFFDPAPHVCAAEVGKHICAHYDDTQALTAFAEGLDVVTYEFENVAAEAVQFLRRLVPVRPGHELLEASQERFAEKDCFTRLGIPTSPFRKLSAEMSDAQRQHLIEEVGLPVILKSRRLGYDGKGQWVVRTAEALTEGLSFARDKEVLVEKLQNFSRELSLVSVRSISGEMSSYPLIENVHFEGILRSSRCPPSFLPATYQAQAEEYASKIAEALSVVGIFTIEFFDVEGRLMANEMAPRVHNSGHWSIEGAHCSQFENHIRAVTGAPLGPTTLTGWSFMANLIGYEPDRRAILSIPGAHFHWYGKSAKPGRKVGHVTLVARTSEEREKRAPEVLRACKEP